MAKYFEENLPQLQTNVLHITLNANYNLSAVNEAVATSELILEI